VTGAPSTTPTTAHAAAMPAPMTASADMPSPSLTTGR
jgi:hypothetical protein